MKVALKESAKEQKVSEAEVARLALTTYFENLGYESKFLREDVDGEKLTRRITIRSVKQALFHSELLIRVFEEALDYDPRRQHNQPPPALRLEDEDYLAELRRLVDELKKLNSFLEGLKQKRSGTTASSAMLQKHLNSFLNKYAATLGTGAGVMTLGAIATLLYQLGVGDIIFDHVLKKIPGR